MDRLREEINELWDRLSESHNGLHYYEDDNLTTIQEDYIDLVREGIESLQRKVLNAKNSLR